MFSSDLNLRRCSNTQLCKHKASVILTPKRLFSTKRHVKYPSLMMQTWKNLHSRNVAAIWHIWQPFVHFQSWRQEGRRRVFLDEGETLYTVKHWSFDILKQESEPVKRLGNTSGLLWCPCLQGRAIINYRCVVIHVMWLWDYVLIPLRSAACQREYEWHGL